MMVCFDIERLRKHHNHVEHQIHNMSTESMDELLSLKDCIKDKMYQLKNEMLQNTLKYHEQMANGMCFDIIDDTNGLEVGLLSDGAYFLVRILYDSLTFVHEIPDDVIRIIASYVQDVRDEDIQQNMLYSL